MKKRMPDMIAIVIAAVMRIRGFAFVFRDWYCSMPVPFELIIDVAYKNIS